MIDNCEFAIISRFEKRGCLKNMRKNKENERLIISKSA